nr:S16 family serine protease [Kofleriaceae bacterium]
MTIKQDAKAPNQALILGTDDKNGSTVIPLPTIENSAGVDALYVKMGGGEKATGGYSPVKLSTLPNQDQTVEVSIAEQMPDGTGRQWRTGVWVSAFVAATTLNKDLTDFKFKASSVGYIDGPSASGLMAGGFLATMTGAAIDPTVSMTGTINPDGTIGPVGGIPEKFAGAIEKGKKRLGYPIGMRMSKSEATGEMVDLVALAKDKGAEAVEIANVRDAYKLLTGKQLPEVVPVAEKEMELDEDTSKAIDAKYDQWKQKLMDEWSGIVALNNEGKLPDTLVYVAQMAQDAGNTADKLHNQGFHMAAYSKMLEAWTYASTATQTASILQHVQSGDAAGAATAIDALLGKDKETTDEFEKIGKIKPNTLGGHLLMLSAYQSALQAWAFQVYSAQGLEATKEYVTGLESTPAEQLQTPEAASEIVGNIASSILTANRTHAAVIQSSEILEYETEKSVNYMCSLPNVKRLSTSYQSAAAAAVDYFESLSGITDDTVRERAALIEPDYLVSYMASKLSDASGVPAELKQKWGENSLPWGLMSLAGSQMAYFRSAELIAKYYSLQVSHDAAGRPTVEHEKAFMNELASAERSAREAARSARIATGAIPVQAKLAYQVAQLDREGSTEDKLHALEEYWASSAFSQAAVMLARN